MVNALFDSDSQYNSIYESSIDEIGLETYDIEYPCLLVGFKRNLP